MRRPNAVQTLALGLAPPFFSGGQNRHQQGPPGQAYHAPQLQSPHAVLKQGPLPQSHPPPDQQRRREGIAGPLVLPPVRLGKGAVDGGVSRRLRLLQRGL